MRGFGGGWSEAKLQCVEDYALGYLLVMQKQSWFKLHYVDGFAGSGLQKLKAKDASTDSPMSMFGSEEEQLATAEFLEGSAIRALRASEGSTRPFDRHVFVEVNAESCADLEARIRDEFPEFARRTECVRADANEYLCEYAESQDWRSTRALVFLDPFGLEVKWETLRALAATKACDVWYLFPLGMIRMLPKSGQIPESWSALLDDLLGTHDWYGEFYSAVTQESLFGPEEITVRDVSVQRVVDYVVSRLGTVFAGVSKPAVLRNTGGSPLFALVMGISNPSPAALRAAKSIANHLTEGLMAAS